MLEHIDDPGQLRTMSSDELGEVAESLRRFLIELTSDVGGHFAGSLGTVELTIALHAVFDTPHDRVIWDVGHQAHGHKVLTGRRDEMRRIKRSDGPSGFLRRSESPYDCFGAGHAGTSISAALGMQEASALGDEGRRVVAVIGDGSATAGMSFEALNHAGELGSRLRVVYNDNGMSIAPSTGGLHRTGRVRDYAESLGWTVLGPVDGHDLDALVAMLRNVDEIDGPGLLHVQTRKGAGYAPAEGDPVGWHATAPFEIASGARRSGASAPVSWTRRFADALIQITARDERVVAITAAMPGGTGLDLVSQAHPGRVYDVGIAEQHAVTFAAGLAAEGQRPVCAIYSTFLQRAFDQIVHDVALQELPVVFALDRAGLVGADGPTHHGALDLAYLRMIPNLVVAAPRDENELQHLLATGVDAGRPFAVRYPRGAAPGAPLDPDPKPLPIGRGEALREGNDVTLVAVGPMVGIALQAAERAAECGIECGVVDARFVKPLDESLIVERAIRSKHVITLEDHALAGGFGSAVLELLAERAPGARVERIGLPDVFIEHGEQSEQHERAGLDVDTIFRRVVHGAARWGTK